VVWPPEAVHQRGSESLHAFPGWCFAHEEIGVDVMTVNECDRLVSSVITSIFRGVDHLS